MSKGIPSARTSLPVREDQPQTMPRAENIGLPKRELRSVCFVLSRSAAETVFNLAKMSLGRLRELLRHERALVGHEMQERHAVSKSEKKGGVIAVRDKKIELVTRRCSRSLKRVKCE